MRILHINNLNQVAQIYGNAFTKRGHSVTIYEPSLVGGHAPLPIKLAMIPWRILDMWQVVDNLNPDYFDIVHIHWASYGVLGLVSRIPFIVHCRGDDVRSRLKRPLFRSILTPILRRAAAVMCSTPDLLPVVQSIRPDVIFFPSPVDTDRFAPRDKCQSCLSQPWTILLFSRLDPDKGVDVAVQGMERFAQRHPNVRTQLLDWGILKSRYRQQYGNRFEFIPFVTPDKVEYLLQSANVIVGQLASGALGLAELQAMSCAKPVIASFRYEEAYHVSPPLFQATTPDEVDEYLEYLFQHPEVAVASGQVGREWVIRYHNYEVVAEELEKLYRSILECTNKKQ